jgi:hypothetical protein
MSKYKIVMVRHGESEWNKLNLFCGWYDANLSDIGKNVALLCPFYKVFRVINCFGFICGLFNYVAIVR